MNHTDHSKHLNPESTEAGLGLYDRVNDTFSQYGFMPHGHCYLWKPVLVSIHVISDFLIGLAYISISLILYGLVKRINLSFNRVVICFGIFIGSCGLTHFMEIWNLWNADYWWSAWVKVITAIASVGTGFYLFKLRHAIVQVAEAAKLAEQRQVDLEDLHSKNIKELDRIRDDFFALANNIPQLAWMTDPSGYITWYNQRWYEYTGTTLQQMQGWGWQAVHHPDHSERVTRRWTEHLQAGLDWEDTFPLKSRTGEYRWFLSRAKPIRDEQGNILRWFGTNTDITDQRLAQENQTKLLKELSFQKNRFETVIKQMPAAIVIAEAPSGQIVFANERLKEVWGHGLIKSSNVDEYVEYIGFHPDGTRVQGHEWPLARSIQKGEIVSGEDYEILRGDGKRAMVRISSTPVRDEDGTIVAGVVISYDVTDKINYERSIKESEAKFRTITNAMPQMIWSTLPDGFHDYYNDKWYEFTGVPYGSTDGEGWLELFHPEDRDRTMGLWRRSLETGEPYELEYRLRHHSGEYLWVLGRALPIKDENGRILRWMGSCTDIDDQKKTQRDLQSALTVRDEFLSIASHELKTPLTSLKLMIQIQERMQKSGHPEAFTSERLQANVEKSEKLINRLDRLINDMLDISRIRTGKLSLVKEKVNLSRVTKEVIDRMQASFLATSGQGIAFLGPTEALVDVDALRIEQVLLNLLQNALKYGQGKNVKVTIVESAEKVTVSVKDEGMGISEEIQDRIFDRFERGISANEISGLGLGLFISREIIRAHGGDTSLESELGRGAVFSFYIPKDSN